MIEPHNMSGMYSRRSPASIGSPRNSLSKVSAWILLALWTFIAEELLVDGAKGEKGKKKKTVAKATKKLGKKLSTEAIIAVVVILVVLIIIILTFYWWRRRRAMAEERWIDNKTEV